MNTLLRPSLAARIGKRAAAFDPAWAAFAGSLLLSAIAIYGMEGPNRDGMLYITTAEIFNSGGLAAARENFDWVFFPICIALLAKLSGLGYESSAYALCVVLMAGSCAALVRITARGFTEAAWCACLVALSLPAFNHYREFLLREFGFWLFCLLAILAAMRWSERPTWRAGMAIQASLAVACLFRVEAVAFYAALALWQLCVRQDWRSRLLHLAMLLAAPVLGACIVIGWLGAESINSSARIAGFAAAIDPVRVLSRFAGAASQFGGSVLNHYSASEAASILAFGLFSMIPKKFLLMNGVFVIPLAAYFRIDSLRRKIACWQPLGWFFAVYVFVLTAFALSSLFLSARYVVFLNLLAIPPIAVGLKSLLDRLPRCRYVLVGIAVLIAVANVVSLSPKSTVYREAGDWLARNAQLAPRMYLGSPRAGYYAGAAYRTIWNTGLPPPAVEQAVREKRFETYVLELDLRDAKEAEWISALNLVEVERFTNRDRNAVIILRQAWPE